MTVQRSSPLRAQQPLILLCPPPPPPPPRPAQATTKDSSAEERLNPVALAQQVGQLKQQLVSAHLDSLLGPQAHINLADPDGALAR